MRWMLEKSMWECVDSIPHGDYVSIVEKKNTHTHIMLLKNNIMLHLYLKKINSFLAESNT